MRVVNRRTGGLLGDRIVRADTFFARARGLLGRPALSPGEGLWIDPCSSIHMFGMRFAIDVLFLDADRRVTRAIADLRPWRIAHGGWSSRLVLEVPIGTIEASGTRTGDVLDLAS